MLRFLPAFRVLCLILVCGFSTAFAPFRTVHLLTYSATVPVGMLAPGPNNHRDMTLNAYKKRAPVTKQEKKEDNEKAGPLKLVLTYLTPWRNPNSIFLYMFLALYILGTISEARSNAAM